MDDARSAPVTGAAGPQIGILLVAHAPVASALASCALHVYGSRPADFAALDVEPEADPAATLARARELVGGLDQGRGVLVLVDLFGATPGNVACEMSQTGKVEVLTGVNLPMLLRALCYRATSSLGGLVDKASAGGTAGVMKIASTAPQQQRATPNSDEKGGAPADPDGTADALARLHHQQ